MDLNLCIKMEGGFNQTRTITLLTLDKSRELEQGQIQGTSGNQDKDQSGELTRLLWLTGNSSAAMVLWLWLYRGQRLLGERPELLVAHGDIFAFMGLTEMKAQNVFEAAGHIHF